MKKSRQITSHDVDIPIGLVLAYSKLIVEYIINEQEVLLSNIKMRI